MAYNEKLADEVRAIISETESNVIEKKMFGGLCFMVNNKMCVGIEKERLMVRLNPAKMDEALSKDGCKPMDFTGRVMKGYVFVDIDVLQTKKQVYYWLELALQFNKIAPVSKSKKKK